MKDGYSSYFDHILTLTLAIQRLSIIQGKAFDVLDGKLDLLGDIKHIYTESHILQKSEFCKHGVRWQFIL